MDPISSAPGISMIHSYDQVSDLGINSMPVHEKDNLISASNIIRLAEILGDSSAYGAVVAFNCL